MGFYNFGSIFLKLSRLLVYLNKGLLLVPIWLILKFRRFSASESLLLFCEARGGSTWLMEVLEKILPVCVNWEPLHPTNGVVPSELNLGRRPYIQWDENNRK